MAYVGVSVDGRDRLSCRHAFRWIVPPGLTVPGRPPARETAIRSRRATLACLLILCVVLLSAYVSESSHGGLHSLQREALSVVVPVQSAAGAAVRPLSNLFGWFGDASRAKGERDDLRRELAGSRGRVLALEAREREARHQTAAGELDAQIASGYRPVGATVVGQDASTWFETVDIDKGSASGVETDDPVIDGEGLIGKVTQTVSDGAQVSLLTDQAVGVSAIVDGSGQFGIVEAKIGDPGTLTMQLYGAANTPPPLGANVVTAGTVSPEAPSLFPRGLPIGRVTAVAEEGGLTPLEIRPFANLRALERVEVLTHGRGSAPSRTLEVSRRLPPL